ncbi:MAG: hypothetical protein ACI9JM_002564 [Halioglobus sp.]|jgi:hypothetical protein
MSSFVWLVTVVVLPSADLTFYRFAKFQPPSLCVAQKKYLLNPPCTGFHQL